MDAEILRGRMPITIRKKLMKKIYDPGNPIIIAGYENKYVFFLIEGEAEASIQNNDGTDVVIADSINIDCFRTAYIFIQMPVKLM